MSSWLCHSLVFPVPSQFVFNSSRQIFFLSSSTSKEFVRSFSQSSASLKIPSISSFASNSFANSMSSSASTSPTYSTTSAAISVPSTSGVLPGVPLASASRPISSSFWNDVYWRVRSLWIPSDHSRFEESEKTILSLVRKPYQQKFVDIGNNLFINTIHFQSPAAAASSTSPSSSSSAAVLLHGYAGGIGSWARNYDSFSTLFPSLYSIDWLGTGRSARPNWTAKGVAESEAFFVDSLENWRKANGISSLELVGHSMGGYLASAYTVRYPQNVSRLILLSPVGMPRRDPAANERWQQLSFTRRMIFGSIRWLFMSGVTPNDLVKFIGPMGHRPVAGYFANRFRFADAANANDEKQTTMEEAIYIPSYNKEIYSNYHYHNLALERSGDAVLSEVLGENVFAYEPMIDRLPSVVVEHNIPTHFVYGEADWMDVRCGLQMSQMISEGQKQRWRSHASGTSFHVTPNAGHQLFIENPKGVYEVMKDIVQIPAKTK